MMPALEAPAVIPQAGFGAVQILDMQQELIPRFLLPAFLIQQDPGAVQEEHRHEQRIVPQLLGVEAVAGHVLESAFLRSRQLRHHPPAPGLHHGKILFIPGLLIQKGHSQHGGGGIDIGRRQPALQVSVIPFPDFPQQRGIPVRQIYLHHGSHRHALGPFPGGQRQMIVPPAVPPAGLQPVQHPVRGFLISIHRILLFSFRIPSV